MAKDKKKSVVSHNEGGPNKQGPNLYGVMGRQSGQIGHPHLVSTGQPCDRSIFSRMFAALQNSMH